MARFRPASELPTAARRSGKRLDARKLHRGRPVIPRLSNRRPSSALNVAVVHILVDMSLPCPTARRKGASGHQTESIPRHCYMLDAIPGVNPAVTWRMRSSRCSSAVKHGETVQNRAGRFGSKRGNNSRWRKPFGMPPLSSPRPGRTQDVDRSNRWGLKTPQLVARSSTRERSNVEVIGIELGDQTRQQDCSQRTLSLTDAAALQRTLSAV